MQVVTEQRVNGSSRRLAAAVLYNADGTKYGVASKLYNGTSQDFKQHLSRQLVHLSLKGFLLQGSDAWKTWNAMMRLIETEDSAHQALQQYPVHKVGLELHIHVRPGCTVLVMNEASGASCAQVPLRIQQCQAD